MLVLSRKESEFITLTIPPSAETREIKVTVTEIRSKGEFDAKVKLGFDADKDVKIMRDNAKVSL